MIDSSPRRAAGVSPLNGRTICTQRSAEARRLRRRSSIGAILLTCVATAANPAHACDVPVFRYALERWPSDVYVATVFHRGELSDADTATVAALCAQSVREGGTANIDVRICDVAGPLDNDAAALWQQQPPDASLPRLVLRTPPFKSGRLVVWTGALAEFDAAQVFDSPVRARLIERLFAGDSVVWIVFTPEADDSPEKVALLARELDRLGNELPLPDGIGLPGSEVYSDVPLTLRFSVVSVRMGDEQERFLESMLRAFAPGAAADEPLAVPVYGRGRALAVVPLADVDVPLIEDLSRFLSGPCSCQVKEQNPGFDLPLAVAWDARLFPDAAPPPDTATDARVKSKLVHIPKSDAAPRSPTLTSAVSATSTSDTGTVPSRTKTSTGAPHGHDRFAQPFAILAVAAGGVILLWSLRGGREPPVDNGRP
jgi:hypothetical protein